MKKNVVLLILLLNFVACSSLKNREIKISQNEVNAINKELKALKIPGTIYFDFDKYDVKSDQKNTISCEADTINTAKKKNIKIEGHADERGTVEYNIVLGQKRADSVKSELQKAGIKEQIKTVSFGKQKPIAQGETEEAYAQNRRAQIIAE